MSWKLLRLFFLRLCPTLNEFNYFLPNSKTNITFKLLSHKDEKDIEQEIKGLKRLKPENSFDISVRLKYLITSVEGNFDKKTVRDFVDKKLIARDSKPFREYVNKIHPGIDTNVSFTLQDGSTQEGALPMTVEFFWPKA